MRIALVSDSHLSKRAPQCVANWLTCASAVSAGQPDLTIHLGDVSLDGVNHPEEIAFAADLVRHWPTAIACIPGNHDMGTGSGEEPLALDAFIGCLDAFGMDRWSQTIGGWTLIGVNAQLFGTDSEHEAAQLEWLTAIARGLRSHDPVVMFSHRPLRRPSHDHTMPTGRYVNEESARWLLKGPLQRHLRAVISGHTHQALAFTSDGVQHVWVPSSAFIINDTLQRSIGQKCVGIGWLELGADRLAYSQVTPPALVAHELTALPFYRSMHPD